MYTGSRLDFEPLNTLDVPFVNPREVLEQGSALLSRFGVEVDPVAESELFQQAMNELNPRFSGDRELSRYELEADDREWSEGDRSLIVETGREFGLLNPETRLTGSYDAVIAMGAARMAPLDRLQYAANAVVSGEAKAKLLIAAGSERVVGDAERSATDLYAPGAVTEFDLSLGAVSRVAHDSRLLVAPLRVPGVQAGNIDVFNAASDALIRQGQLTRSLGAVTTEIYRKATEMDLRIVAREKGIPYIAVAGNPSDPAIVDRRTPATYLAEVVRTMRSASALAAQGAERSGAEAQRRTEVLDGFLEDKGGVERIVPGEYADYSDGRTIMRAEFDPRSGELTTWLRYSSGLWYDGPDDYVGYYE